MPAAANNRAATDLDESATVQLAGTVVESVLPPDGVAAASPASPTHPAGGRVAGPLALTAIEQRSALRRDRLARHGARPSVIAAVAPIVEPAPIPPTVSVVIPAMNEALNLPHVLARLPAMVTEVIVVDGHSTDETIAIALSCRPDAQIMTQSGRGKGDALACGFRAVTSEVTVMLDADGSTDPAEIPRFVAALTNGYDFAKGTRFVTGGGSADITQIRRLGNWVLTTMVNRIWHVGFSDLCYGYNAFWTDCVSAGFTDCDGFEVETLMNIRVAASEMRVIEVPSHEASRRHGESNLRIGRDGTRVMRTILAEWMRPT